MIQFIIYSFLRSQWQFFQYFWLFYILLYKYIYIYYYIYIQLFSCSLLYIQYILNWNTNMSKWDQMSLQDAMDAAYQDITTEHWIPNYSWISKDSSQDALPEEIAGVMWMRTCGQTQKTRLIRLYLFIIILWLSLFVYFVLSHNKWHIFHIFCFYAFLFSFLFF